MKSSMRRMCAALFGISLGLLAHHSPAVGQADIPLPTRFRTLQNPYFVISTDLPPEDAQEATLRLSRVAEEIAERTKGYGGRVSQRLTIVIFKDMNDYYAAGGQQGTAGGSVVRNGQRRGMVTVGAADQPNRWRVLHHQALHQFLHASIGEVPTWVAQGLAEYVGDGVWTGDSFMTGFVRPERMQLLRERMDDKRLLSIPAMMQLTGEQWNAMATPNNSIQAWSLAHFLAHGENNKYQVSFNGYMRGLGRKQTPEKAWVESFGPVTGLEEKWVKWWSELPPDPTAELYTRATVSTFASFLARAHAQQKAYGTIDDLASAIRVGEVRLTGENWLPIALLDEAIARSKRDATTYTIEPARVRGGPPTVVAVRPNGAKFIASFPPKLALPLKVTIAYTPGYLKLPAGDPDRRPGATTRPADRWATPSTLPATRPDTPPIASRPPVGQQGPAAQGPKLSPVTVNPNGDRCLKPLKGPEAAIQFMTDNCAFGSKDEAVTGFAEKINRAVQTNTEAYIVIGNKLLKSGRTTGVLYCRGRVFIFEFTADEAKLVDTAPDSLVTATYKRRGETCNAPTVEFTPPQLLSPVPATNIDRVRFGYRFTRVEPGTRPIGMRVKIYGLPQVPESVTTFNERPTPQENRGTANYLNLTFAEKSAMAIVVFDAIHPPAEGKADSVEVLSEPYAVLLNVQAK